MVARTSLGESQDWSWATSGCARRSLLVRFSYSFKALLKISWKLGEGESVEWGSDMRPWGSKEDDGGLAGDG